MPMVRLDDYTHQKLKRMSQAQGNSMKTIIKFLIHRIDLKGRPYVGNCVDCGERISFSWKEIDGIINMNNPSHSQQGFKCPKRKLS